MISRFLDVFPWHPACIVTSRHVRTRFDRAGFFLPQPAASTSESPIAHVSFMHPRVPAQYDPL